jgi:hypothetical protein
MNAFIAQLDDHTALRILRAIVQHELAPASSAHSLDSATIEALGAQVEATRVSKPITDGDIARSALQLLASEDPKMQQRIEALAGIRTEQFLDPITGGLLLTTAVAIVLQTKFDLRYDKTGWKFQLSKPTVSLKDFKDLVSKLMSWWPHQ